MAKEKENITVNDKTRGCYGMAVKPQQAQEWILRGVQKNIQRQAAGMPRATYNIWGQPGCGKTSIIKQLQTKEVPFQEHQERIHVVDVPLAQIEEMGDILGFPVEEIQLTDKTGETRWVKAVDAVIRQYLADGYALTDNKRTTYAPPAWVPTEAHPGVILFDDGNRASQRIMRGLMQLVQDYRTISWAIPEGWTIVFTGNPDNRYNQVTSMDAAQLTRMKHITLKPDEKEWALWATSAGIDPRGINFILRYPEMMVGKERTNPRSLTEVFYALADFDDLTNKEQYGQFMVECHASLDEETCATLGTFLTRECDLVIDPKTILESPAEATPALNALMNPKGGGESRTDIVSVCMNRLVAYILSDGYQKQKSHGDNFRTWIFDKAMPKDIVYAGLLWLSSKNPARARDFIVDRKVIDMVHDMYKKEAVA